MVTKKSTLTEKTPSGHGPVRKFQTGGFLNYEEYQRGFLSTQMRGLNRQWNGW